MGGIQNMIQTAKNIVPMIYAYTTPGVTYHDGWTKIGYTEQDVDKRIKQQTHTADIHYKLEWKGMAIYDDGSGVLFSDRDFHAFLRQNDIQNTPNTEWFLISPDHSQNLFFKFRSNRGLIEQTGNLRPYRLRKEQQAAVDLTADYYRSHPGEAFLWNAKPRFGKTLAVYDFCKTIDAQTVLIVTNRPAIANSWYSDYAEFLGQQSGYCFVSRVDGIKDKPFVMSSDDYQMWIHDHSECQKCIKFVSLQDLKGSDYFGGQYNKLEHIKNITWDVLVIDEAHEGVDTYKTDVAFNQIRRKFALHLSGTPFKALANDKFETDGIFNWTYADEQAAKSGWNPASEFENPYEDLPKLNLFTYQMSEMIADQIRQGIEIDGETEEFAFDLNLFFAVNDQGRFIHDAAVSKFLDALTTQEKYPFSTEVLRQELKHSFWLLNRVDSAKALAKKLKNHPVFKDYHIVLAAGDGKLDDEAAAKKAFDQVKQAIAQYDKTITLSVGQLATGVTIPEWTAVLMLSNIKSPALYMQAAFRAQNPCKKMIQGHVYRKENASVFDFDPARTLIIFEQFANDLCTATVNGFGDTETRKANVRTLLNFFPVIGEDETGEMVALDAEKVLSIPRKIKSREVVRRGFMSNFLFQNISAIFSAPPAVWDLINTFPEAKDPDRKNTKQVDRDPELKVDPQGQVLIEKEKIIGLTQDLFGEAIYDQVKSVETVIDHLNPEEMQKMPVVENKIKTLIQENAIEPIVDLMKNHYGEELKKSDAGRIERQLQNKAEFLVRETTTAYQIETRSIENERAKALKNRFEDERSETEITEAFDRMQQEAVAKMQADLKNKLDDYFQTAAAESVQTAETHIQERKKNQKEDEVRDHLRGFARIIPSFLMAYGNDTVTLDNFDQIIPDRVFQEVTGITTDEFRFLRDGGDYIDESSGEERHFDGHLFEPVVFDDSVREFMRLRCELADYFDESRTEDIFDYIPPQKTNQIFTPKRIVGQMADLLEQENPGCFDDPDKTFIDLYMKSGLYVTEIVKRLYQSEKMREIFPDDRERLRHIFEHQVYGLAPTEIIYRIASNYILGFDEDLQIPAGHFVQADALPYAKAGNLNELLDRVFEV